jgi:hypothetical protein
MAHNQPPQPPALPSAPPNDKAALDAILTKLETHSRNIPVLTYVTSPVAKVARGVEIPLFDQLVAIGKVPELDLVLLTGGGDAEAPWRIVSLLREYATKLNVLLPHYAMSAGTTITMGANEIVMTPLSCLGPIDPSRTHPLLPRRDGSEMPEPISVQDMRHAMQFIRDAAAPKGTTFAYTPEAMANIFGVLFEKIHPLAIGAIEQSYALAKLVGRRCLETHMPCESEADSAKITGIVDALCDDYKSHSYQIGRREAKKIGLNVVDADPPTEALLVELLKFYSSRPLGPFGNGPAKPGQQARNQIAWLDSRKLKMRVMQEVILADKGRLEALADAWSPY